MSGSSLAQHLKGHWRNLYHGFGLNLVRTGEHYRCDEICDAEFLDMQCLFPLWDSRCTSKCEHCTRGERATAAASSCDWCMRVCKLLCKHVEN